MGQNRHTLSTAFRPSVYSTGIQPRLPYSVVRPQDVGWKIGGYNYGDPGTGHFDDYGNWLWDNTVGAVIEEEKDIATGIAKKVAIVAGVGIVAVGLYEYGVYKMWSKTYHKFFGKK